MKTKKIIGWIILLLFAVAFFSGLIYIGGLEETLITLAITFIILGILGLGLWLIND